MLSVVGFRGRGNDAWHFDVVFFFEAARVGAHRTFAVTAVAPVTADIGSCDRGRLARGNGRARLSGTGGGQDAS